ncbi:MAG TPA: tetratricopeptide repeat protein [Candidatus Didemnitutus sp.]|nr:tetratricopeptide repeat protein [Candidatus Didemnitutus sp.]
MQHPSARAARPHSWIVAAALCGALLVCYWPVLRGELIWNDHDYVTKPALRSLEGLGRIWFQPGATEQYYPLLHSAFWVQGHLWGDATLGYHLATLALHAMSCVLFALILQRLAVPGAWLAALIFALHPVHVESVAWIAEQKNTLSLALYLAAALSYLRFDDTRDRTAYFAAFGWFVLSLLCKTVTASLPVALLLVFWWKRGRLDLRRDVAPLAPWLAVGLAAGLFASWVEQRYVGAHGEDFSLSFAGRVLVAGRAVWFYLRQVDWPVDLNFVYPRWQVDPAAAWQWLFPLGVLAVAAGLWAIRHITRAPFAVFGFFVVSLFPVLGFVNLFGSLYSWVWDHWQYLADLGPIALIAAGLTQGWESLVPQWRRTGAVLAGVLAVVLGGLSWRHAHIFTDSETLFRATLARNPGCWMAHNNLANLLLKFPERRAEAIEHYEQALRTNPDDAMLHNNLAMLLAKSPGRAHEAAQHFQRALQLNPNLADVHNSFGAWLVLQPGRQAEALVEYQEALRLDPNHIEAHINLASLLANWPGREADAIAHAQRALELDPRRANPHCILAIITGRRGDFPTAIAHCQSALEISPGNADARRLLDDLEKMAAR